MGMANHTPVEWNNLGNVKSVKRINTKVREKEIRADIRPLDRAVKKAEANILKPLKRKLKEKIIKPFLAKEKTFILSWTKMETISVPKIKANEKITNEDDNTNILDNWNNFFKLTLLSAP